MKPPKKINTETFAKFSMDELRDLRDFSIQRHELKKAFEIATEIDRRRGFYSDKRKQRNETHS